MIRIIFLLAILFSICIVCIRLEKEPIENGFDRLLTATKASKTISDKSTEEAGLGFVHAFVASFSMIIVSEIGDKTFFIAAIMAMKHSRCTVFIGAISALALMTILSGLDLVITPSLLYATVMWWRRISIRSARLLLEDIQRLACLAVTGTMWTTPTAAMETFLGIPPLFVAMKACYKIKQAGIWQVVFGWAATVIPRAYTFYISTVLFAIFGIKMLREGYKMSSTESQEEYDEVQLDLRKRDEQFEKEAMTGDVEGGIAQRKGGHVLLLVSRIIIQAFTLTFLAEWGDRSQLATIILAAREDVFGVTIGGIAGHSICTGLAVIGGRFIAQRISVRTVTIIGGIVFLIFAFSALIVDPSWGS